MLDESARRFLSPVELETFQRIPLVERESQLKALLEAPIARFTPVNETYFRARWAEVLSVAGCDAGATLLEVATGDADMIPQSLARACPGARYITANMNQKLNASLLKKTQGLPLRMELIAGDAVELDRHIAPGSVDLVAFQHAVNDVLQAILCNRDGIDTTSGDWMKILPRMIEILQREEAQGSLEASVRGPFLALVEVTLRALKPGGLIAMNHYLFQLDLDWGYPPRLFDEMIPMTRPWLQSLPACREVTFPGFDPHWWSFWRKEG